MECFFCARHCPRHGRKWRRQWDRSGLFSQVARPANQGHRCGCKERSRTLQVTGTEMQIEGIRGVQLTSQEKMLFKKGNSITIVQIHLTKAISLVLLDCQVHICDGLSYMGRWDSQRSNSGHLLCVLYSHSILTAAWGILWGEVVDRRLYSQAAWILIPVLLLMVT